MDQVTQQDAALAEESAAAADSLQGQASQLLESVSVFKLKQAAHRPLAVAAPVPAPRPVASAVRKSAQKLPSPGAAASCGTPTQPVRAAGLAAPQAAHANGADTSADKGEWASF
jgi:methyl-accepting chemotaxis protein